MRVSSSLLIYGGAVLVALGAGVALWMLFRDPNSFVRRGWRWYVEQLDKECRFLLYKMTGQQIAQRQLGVIVLLLAAALGTGKTVPAIVAVAVAVLPFVALRRAHNKRIIGIETQLDSWLLLLANALKATSSVGEAIEATSRIIRPPIQQELDLLIKEVNLGNPVDQAIVSVSNRIGSPLVAGAMATILVGRQTGGDLPRILQESAASLREMARLEGVFRAKTAEGKAQSWFMALMPLALVLIALQLDPHWFDPLTSDTLGYIIIGAATVLWIVGVLIARQILTMDV